MLAALRAHIESLASETGEYTLVCSRHGEQPVPAAGLRFPSRAVARSAAAATAQYRDRLREYDPSVPAYDIVVWQGYSTGGATESDDHPVDATAPAPPVAPNPRDEPLIRFCHGVAAAVFEALGECGHDEIETALMAAYGDHADIEPTADGLCLRLLERMSTMLAERLSHGEQAALLDTAAEKLPAVTDGAASADVDAVVGGLRTRQVVGQIHEAQWEQCRRTGTRTARVDVSSYAFTPHGGRLPTLPLVVAFYGAALEWRPAAISVAAAGDGWRFRIAPVGEARPAGLVRAAIDAAAVGCP